MNRLTTFLLALLLITLGASAQSSITLGNSSWYAGSGTTTSASDYGSYAKENYNGSGHSAGVLLHQTITGLTANANYVIEFFAAVNNANNASTPSGEGYAQVYAGSTTKDITVENKSASDFPNGSESAILGWGDAYHHLLLATADASGQIDFGVQNVTAAGNWAIAYAVSATLIDSEWTGNATAHKCTANVDDWSISGNTNGDFHSDTWAGETDASGMVTPFLEYWVGSWEGNLSAATISHETLTSMPEGEYTLSVDARIFSEAGNTITGTGTVFAANGASVDLISSGTAGVYGTETEVYGTYHLIAEVDEKGTLDISFTIPEGVAYNWIAFKNLDIVYTGESLPTLEYVTGTMNVDVEAAMKAAIDAYNDSKSADDYATALEAIDVAEASVAYYANVADAIENVLPTITLDDLGKAAWENGSFLTGYNARTLTNESVTAAFISAEASQAAGTELVYALTANEWICSTNGDGQGNGPTYMNPGYETYTGDSYVAGKVMFQRLSDLPDGYSYKVEFYGSAKSVNGGGNSVTGTGTAVAFANDKQQAVNIVSTPNSNDLLTGGYLRSFSMVTVDEDNALEYGLMNLATGGNWYMCDNYKITVLGVVEDAIIGDAEASATYVQPGQEVSITFDVTAPSEDYELVGSDFTTSDGILVSYSGEGVFTFTVPSGATANSTISVTIPVGQLYYTYEGEKVGNEDGSNAETTIEVTVVVATITDGEYLIVDADGYYLGGGLTWGTQAAIIGKPQFIGFEKQENGTYHLDSHQYNDADSHYLGANLYFDNATPVDWIIAEVEGGYTIYGTADEGTGYLTSNGFQTEPTIKSDPYVWTLLTKDDVVDSMAGATEDAPVDVTALIAAPELKRNSNTTYYPTWTVTGFDGTDTPSNYAFGGGSAVANCAESYHSTNGFNFSQEITLPLEGKYTLGAKGFYRDDSSETLLLPVLYAGEKSVAFPEITRTDEYLGVEDNMANAYQEFLLGLHTIDAITITTTSDKQTVIIGFKGEDTSLWNIMGELELLYYGEVELQAGDEAHSCIAEFDHWTQTFTDSEKTNGAYAYNDWSTETDASGMVTPYLQTWVYGELLSDQTIDHDQLTDLPQGWYTVTVDARIMSETGADITGTATLTANDDYIYIISDGTDGTYGTETEEYGTYTVQCYVDEDGTLDIGFTIANATFNWFAWKNLSVVYLGETVEYNVGEATASTTIVTPGQTVTLKFADCTKGDEGATLGVSSTASVTFGETAVTLTTKGTITFTFDVPEDVITGEYTLTIPENTIVWTLNNDTKVGNAAQTITFTVPYMLPDGLTSGMFLKNLYNNDLMSRGKDYGTRADVDFIGIPLTLSLNDQGKYLIRYADADLSAATYNYLYGDNWAWTDGSATNAATFTIEEVYDEDTQELLGYHFISDYGYLYRYDATMANANDTGNNYALAVNGVKGVNYSDDNQIIWTFVGIEERDAIKAAWVARQKVAIATEAGLDITTADEFDAYVATLTSTAIVENEISTAEEADWTGGTFTEYGVESFQTATRLTRSFTGLEPGIYKITLNGLDRNSSAPYSTEMYNAGYTDLSESYIYANGYEINLKTWASDRPTEEVYNEEYAGLIAANDPNFNAGWEYFPNSMYQSSLIFGDDAYQNELYTYVGEEGTLDIQIAMLVTEISGWAQVKNFSLYYLGETISWEMTSVGWGTLILPFAADIPTSTDKGTAATLTVYTCAELEDDETTLILDEADTIEACTPYLVSGTAGTYTFTGTPINTEDRYSEGLLTGTLVNMSQENGDFTTGSGQYVLQNHEDEGLAFYQITSESSGVTLNAYHCYLTYTGAEPAALRLPGMVTGIEAVEGDVIANDAIYDLSGRKVSKAVKGVYIVNGKKVLVK